jgi:hypothetical protein
VTRDLAPCQRYRLRHRIRRPSARFAKVGKSEQNYKVAPARGQQRKRQMLMLRENVMGFPMTSSGKIQKVKLASAPGTSGRLRRRDDPR